MCGYELVEQIASVCTQGIINAIDVAKCFANAKRAAPYELQPRVATNRHANCKCIRAGRHQYEPRCQDNSGYEPRRPIRAGTGSSKNSFCGSALWLGVYKGESKRKVNKQLFSKSYFHAYGGSTCGYDLINAINVAKCFANTNRAAPYEVRPRAVTNHNANCKCISACHNQYEPGCQVLCEYELEI